MNDPCTVSGSILGPDKFENDLPLIDPKQRDAAYDEEFLSNKDKMIDRIRTKLKMEVDFVNSGDMPEGEPEMETFKPAQDEWLEFAFDRASVRDFDLVGRLHVEITNISKACVNEYKGGEIPRWRELGLNQNKRYRLLRHPDELEKAADTFNNLPLLSKHVPVNIHNHQPELVIGSTGTDAEFRNPFLRNSLVIWQKQALLDVLNEDKKELSSAYRYRADMTPGSYGGEAYDGVMRELVGNHVALCKTGRAGHDVVVGDSLDDLEEQQEEFDMPENKNAVLSAKAVMTMGALAGYLRPKLAEDAKLPDLTPLVRGLTAKNYTENREAIADVLKRAVGGKLKLAKDEDLEDVEGVLMALDDMDEPDASDTAAKDAAAKDAIKCEEEKDDDDDKKDDKKMPFKKDDDKAEDKAAADMVTKPAMDAAIKEATENATREASKSVREQLRGVHEALRLVYPYVGNLAMDAYETDADVYKHALKMLNVDVKDVHPTAYKKILEVCQKPGERRPSRSEAHIAMDASGDDDFDKEMFKGTDRIGYIA